MYKRGSSGSIKMLTGGFISVLDQTAFPFVWFSIQDHRQLAFTSGTSSPLSLIPKSFWESQALYSPTYEKEFEPRSKQRTNKPASYGGRYKILVLL